MQWKQIKGYEGYYEVSDTGLVRSVDRIIPDAQNGCKHLKGRLMKLSKSKSRRDGDVGYLVVNLRKYHTTKVIPVHRIVAENFIPNIYNQPTVNHIDGDKHNNCVENLEWVSYSDNNTHALINNLRKPRGNAVIQMTGNGKVINIFKSACEASRVTGIDRSAISHCINHRMNSAGGYMWDKFEKCNDYSYLGSTTDDELLSEAQEPHIAEDIVCTDGNI